jgi:hypothetical protein
MAPTGQSGPAMDPRQAARMAGRIKRGLVVASISGMAALWLMAAHHVVGVTARSDPAPSPASGASSFFSPPATASPLGGTGTVTGPMATTGLS